MKYPVNTEMYIAAIRAEFGRNDNAEKIHRDIIIPFVNESYAAGLCGAGRFPLDEEKQVHELAEHLRETPEIIQENPMLLPLIRWANSAYAQGRKDAGR